jgi:hypothetical protein
MTATDETVTSDQHRLMEALSTVGRLFRQANDEMATARHHFSESQPNVANLHIREAAKKASDALSILQLLPDVTGALRPVSQPSTLTSQPVPNA